MFKLYSMFLALSTFTVLTFIAPSNVKAKEKIFDIGSFLGMLSVTQENIHLQSNAESCIKSICNLEVYSKLSLKNSVVYMNATDLRQTKNTIKYFDQHIGPILSPVIKLIEKNKATMRVQILDYLKKIPRNKSFYLDDLVKSLIQYKIILDNNYDYFNKGFYDKKYFIKHRKLKIKSNFLQSISVLNKREINRVFIFYNKLVAYRNSLFKGKSKVEAVEIIRNRLKIIKQYSPIAHQFLLKGFKTNQGLSFLTESFNIDKHMENIDRISFISSIIKKPWKEFNILKARNAFLNKTIIRELIKIKGKIKEEPETKSKKDILNRDIYHDCKVSISAYIATRPTEDEINNFKDYLQKTNTAVKKIANRMYKNQKRIINKLLSSTEFIYPKTSLNIKDSVLNSVGRLRRGSENKKNFLKNLSVTQLDNFMALLVIYRENDVFQLNKNYIEVKDFCLGYLPQNQRKDGFLPKTNLVSVSRETVVNYKRQIGVTIHELGHRLHGLVKNSLDKGLALCIKKRYKDKLDYFKEDLADNFSNSVLKELNYTSSSFNHLCYAVKLKAINGFTQPVQFENYIHPMLPNAGDSHSSITFRMMQTADDLGHSTNSCLKFADDEGGKVYKDNNLISYTVPVVKQCTVD